MTIQKFGTGDGRILRESEKDQLGREIPEDGMVSPDGDDAEAHQRMVDSWEQSPHGPAGPPQQ